MKSGAGSVRQSLTARVKVANHGFDDLHVETTARMVLGLAMLASAGLILWLGRGGTFFIDEVQLLARSTDLPPGEVFEPWNGHLYITSRLIYKGTLEVVGAEYLAIRILTVASLLILAAALYALVKRRIGPVAALAPAIVILFFGSAWQHLIPGVGITSALTLAMGVGALLALERGDRRGDVAACALFCAAVATFTVGLAFVVGGAVSVLLRGDRWRRSWIFAIPLLLYAVWWVWSLQFETALSETTSSTTQTQLSNLLLLPNWIADSLAFVSGALLGLDYHFSTFADPFNRESGWGRVVAALLVGAVAWRFRRRPIPASLWASLAVLLSYWALGALAAGPVRTPEQIRYLLPGAIVVLLVATDAARGIRFSRPALVGLFGVVAVSLATNLALLRDGAAYFRDEYSAGLRTDMAMLELAGERVAAGFVVARQLDDEHRHLSISAGDYGAAVEKFGSPAFTLQEVKIQPEPIRLRADEVLAAAYEPRLEPRRRRPETGCERITAVGADPTIAVEVPRGGAIIEAEGPSAAEITLRRFAESPSISVGQAQPGQAYALVIPTDGAVEPWYAATTAEALRVCGSG